MIGGLGSERLYVIKRNGMRENVMFDKITSRIKKLCYGLSDRYVDPVQITMKAISGMLTKLISDGGKIPKLCLFEFRILGITDHSSKHSTRVLDSETIFTFFRLSIS